MPSLTFSEQDAGRIAGVIAMIPVLRDIAGLIGLAEQVKLKEAQTALLLTDNETTEQVAAATARHAPPTWALLAHCLGAWAVERVRAGAIPTRVKVIAAAFLMPTTKLVAQVRMLQAKELPPPVATSRSALRAGPPSFFTLERWRRYTWFTSLYKIPESVLVVIHTPALEVLLIQRADTAQGWSIGNRSRVAKTTGMSRGRRQLPVRCRKKPGLMCRRPVAGSRIGAGEPLRHLAPVAPPLCA